MKETKTKKNALPFRAYLPGLLLALFGTLMIFLCAPVQQYLLNADDFIYDLYDLLRMILPVWLLAFLALSGVLSLLRRVSGKLFSLALAVCLWGTLSLYAEGNFLSGYLPSLNGKRIDWSALSAHRLSSVLVWGILAVLAAAALFFLKGKKLASLASYVGGFGSALLVLTLVFSLNGPALRDKEDFYSSGENLLTLSRDRNLVLFILDEIDGDDFNLALEAEPELAESLEDFTFYRNTLGAYPGTKWAIPYLISGIWFENQEGFYRYREHAYVESPLLNDLKARGWRMGSYDEELPPAEQLLGFFDNLASPEARGFQHPGEFRKLQLMLTGLRYLPFDLKKFCVLTPDNIYYDSLKNTSGGEPFLWGNDLFLDRLENEGLTLTDEPCFRMIHLQGVHDPFDYQLEMDGGYGGTYEDAEKVCLRLIAEFTDALKENGIYDNTAVVVTGDHGHRPDVLYNMNPALFVKGMDERHAFAVSDAPVSHEDFPEAFARLTDGKNGEEVFDAREGEDRERRFLSTYMWDDDHIVEFTQHGAAKDVDALVRTGNVFTPDGPIVSFGDSG